MNSTILLPSEIPISSPNQPLLPLCPLLVEVLTQIAQLGASGVSQNSKDHTPLEPSTIEQC
jgi:hypothetical protein